MLSGNTLPAVSKWSIFVTGLPWPLTARWCGSEKAMICWHLYLETTLRQRWQRHLSGVTERGCARTVGQVRKMTNTRPVLAWRVDLFLNLSVSVKWCQSDLDGDCRLASLQCCFDVSGAGHFTSWAFDPDTGSQPSSHWAYLIHEARLQNGSWFTSWCFPKRAWVYLLTLLARDLQ